MTFLWKIAFEKATKKMVQLIISFLIAQNLGRFGVTIDPNQMTIALFGLIELLRNWLKVKMNVRWL